ncbi:carbohydrate ABC transporter ATP-binding protein, CUT1 family [Thalassovita litoralis]|uniref:Carbohydrate ABC transporter ATP-binding protein, CUT1 family n=1 Tax=Thalassovita litoralis TaxID=1010611 RepID=A0A521FR99_9RHOB|nr:ABC transporter ATP-binding protein [Thalassovita litoralis]SMO98755.1 carbohydrate ABC transporter ATP-binding protein, CUT1 family [Thalassovita litoralis]
MARLTLSDIHKSFGSTEVLKGISLDVANGEFLSLVGSSGCGKSTLLRIISGLETPDRGTIEIDGKAMTALAPKARGVAMVFQDYALYPHMTVAQNMAMPLIMARLPFHARLPGMKWLTPHLAPLRAEMAGQVEQVAQQLHIDHLLERRPAQLSGGQRQRVALGRALVRNPTLFLMDEPLSNLDAKLRVKVRTEIVDLHRASGLTFVYVTHDQVEAMTMSDRVALLQAGTLLQVAPPATLYAEPQSIDVAKFIGSPEINLLPVCAEPEGLRLGATLLPLSHGFKPGTDLIVGLRPEALRLSAPGLAQLRPAEGPELQLDMVQASIEDLGSEIVVHGAVAALPDIALRIRAQKSLQSGVHKIALPERLSLHAPMATAVIFDINGKRLDPQSVARRQEALA